ncbi:MAG TPA: fatty acid--CoA ligase family protein [Acidimicrobiales bacterium]|nr:fatty acid--CoA ligase family protein [Acidimicrobiales bacterium]
MRRLVVVEARGTPGFADRLRRAWDEGDAVLPVDPRHPAPDRARVLEAARPGEPVEEGDALVVATSGATGTPKAVVLTHDAVAASARATSARLGVDPDRDRWLACLPLVHVGGLSVVTRALVTGTPLTIHDGFDPAAVMAAAAAGCTLVSLVPAALRRIDPSGFRAVVVGGSSMPPDLPPQAVTTYGATETGSGVVYDGVPLDGVEVRTVGGEIQVRGPMLLRGYRDGTDPKDADGWYATGDAGAWDPAAGRLQVFGRTDDLIITGGENVWPASVERVLGTCPGVAEVAVAGRPDPEWGQRVVALVVPADPADPPALAALRDAVRAELPAYAAPRELVLVASLPHTPLGKIARGRLR